MITDTGSPSTAVYEVWGARRCVELEYPINVCNIDTAGHNVSANQKTSCFKAPKLVKYFEAGRFQFPVYAHHRNRWQKADEK